MKYFFLFTLIFGLSTVYFTYQQVFAPVVTHENKLFIQKNTNYVQLAKKLESLELIKNRTIFDILAKKMNLERNIHPGKFVFIKGESTIDVIKKLRGNFQSPVKLVLNNINFKQDLAHKVSQQLDIDSLEIYQFLNDKKSLKKLGLNPDNIMCKFIPNTYEIYWSISLEEYINKMLKEHDIFWNEDRKTLAKKLNLNTDEVFVLASIVEKEYKFASERKCIAGVYINRLDKGMPLQADPTCKFAWGDLSIKRVLNIHTQNAHAYNTYYIKGLPPGPICLPETNTIDDVLHAEKHAYIYFCAHADLDGKHEFNTNLAAHNNAANKYQRALNKLKIY